MGHYKWYLVTCNKLSQLPHGNVIKPSWVDNALLGTESIPCLPLYVKALQPFHGCLPPLHAANLHAKHVHKLLDLISTQAPSPVFIL
jgi:hypothetical protein